MMAGPGYGNFGMSGRGFDAFVSTQHTFTDNLWSAKLQEKYWLARQKFLEKIEKKEDECIVLSDAKLDSKLGIYRTINKSCARLVNILENYQNGLYVFANEENALGILLKECGKCDKTKAGEIMTVVGKSLTASSHQRIKLYLPLLRMYQEIETFHTRAVEDTSETVSKLESKRSKYRASLLWMKNVSENLDPDVYKQLDKFRRVQNQVRGEKKIFDALQMDVVQKIDLLMASRCNLFNQILSSYQTILLETFEKNLNNFKSVEEIIKEQDIYEYEFKQLKELNPLKISDNDNRPEDQNDADLLLDVSKEATMDDANIGGETAQSSSIQNDGRDTGGLIEVAEEDCKEIKSKKNEDDMMQQLQDLFGSSTSRERDVSGKNNNNYNNIINIKGNSDTNIGSNPRSDLNSRLLLEDEEQQLADLLGPSENITLSDISSSSKNCGNEKPIDLVNELDDIDNSAYFKSLQKSQI